MGPPLVAVAAVIGAGVMGAGIAQWLSAKHLPTILRDTNTGTNRARHGQHCQNLPRWRQTPGFHPLRSRRL